MHGDPGAGSGAHWYWILWYGQFSWLKQTLEDSDAVNKFVFAHLMVGDADDYVRGGANPAHLVEWGDGVIAFFHDHDHQYGYEARDGVVYQSLPKAGFSGNGFGIHTIGSGYTIKALPSPGHLRVTVNPSITTVDYIATTGAGIEYSYDIEPNEPPDDLLGDGNGSGEVDSTDALIILSADVGIDVTSFCPMNCGDVNEDGSVNSTDNLIILSYDVGLPVSFDVGQPGCSASVTQPPGCSP